MTRRTRPRRAAAAAALTGLIVTGALTGAGAAPAGAAEDTAEDTAFTQGFESGALPDGWRITEGSFGQLVTDRAQFHNSATPYLREGNWHLSTLETPTQTPSDGYRGTVVSPAFTLTRPTVTMLVGGGSSATTYVALCAYDAAAADGCGHEIAQAHGANSEVMQYRTLDGTSAVGRQVVLKVVDHSTGSWGHVTLDDIRANVPPAATAPRVDRTKTAVHLTWTAAPDPTVTGYAVYRSTQQSSGYTRLGTATSATYSDSTAGATGTYFYRIAAVDAGGAESEPVTTLARPYTDLRAKGSPVTYEGDTLSDTRFAVGPLGSAGIVQDGTGARPTWWIFNNIGQLASGGWQNTPDTYTKGKVPNSFFAVRAQQDGGQPVVRALQTTGVGAFPAMKSLKFQGEYPLADYAFQDDQLPVQVSENVLNPMIPGDTKDSAIPTAMYRFTLKNPSDKPVTVSLLASQQNAVGFSGYDTIGGADDRVVAGYGGNHTEVASTTGAKPATSLRMSGATGAGTMNLTAYGDDISASSSWDTLSTLKDDLAADGELSGPATADSPAAQTTVDGALSVKVTLAPGASRTVPVNLNWHFPGAKNPNGGDGRQYENWWTGADDVADYVTAHYDQLLGDTTAYHDSLYNTNMPRYLIDRVSAATAVLHSPSVWWARNGFFGAREGWGCCPGMPTHVFHYAQAQAWLWPEVGRRWTQQWLDNTDTAGKIPMRFSGDSSFTMDGQTGVILSAYRTYETTDKAWLDANWPTVKRAMDYVVNLGDQDHDGILTGSFNTTLDGGETGNGSWLGSLYLASVHASQKMAEAEGDTATAALYSSIYEKGRVTGEKDYFNGEYYTEINNGTGASYGNGSEIDMLLGQWWSTQLGLGDIYDTAHMNTAAKNLFTDNYRDNLLGDTPYSGYNYAHQFRQYALETDGGLQMTTWPHHDQPSNTPLYYDELMSGFEYSAASLMLQRGQVDEGLKVVKAVSDRYNGVARKGPYINMSTCSTGDGTGSPFGDDECGKYYGRTLSSYSLLTALQGFSWNAPEGAMAFNPTWQPENHKSFFSTGDAWGTFTQKRTGGKQTDTLQVRHGSLDVRTLTLKVPEVKGTLTLKGVGSKGPLQGAQLKRDGDTVTVTLAAAHTFAKGEKLTVTLG
ncbi:GH116 family glycosyl-hydrolase [Streptomyces sp. NBC_01465]|uniref:GH116 family glycosyl-hydrolase n=1 Tax=Streptomyces sp. NBC_01465 TaxID=2903878 RepID=UPI002E33E664|nr:GH116 family glycosyl-hydrolase [Streptomyces sp. NBC_01465]